MRRRVPIARNVTMGLLALLCVATAGLWVRSYCRADVFGVVLGHRTLAFNSFDGVMSISWQTDGSGTTGTFWFSPSGRARLDRALRNLRQFDARAETHSKFRELTLIFPHWAFTLAAGLLSIILPNRRTKPRTVGACPTCGYDLRATPDHCPECGTIPTTNALSPGATGR